VTGVAFGTAPGDVVGNVGTGVAGTYGSLSIAANGDYVYTLDNTNAAVQGLDSNESLSEVFTYTITDGDGDTSTTTVTITINGADDGVTINGLDGAGAEETLYEDDLADGSSPDAPSLTQTGTFTVDSPDGLATLTVGGVTVFDASASTTYPVTIDDPAYGLLTITGVTPVTDGDGDVVSATIAYSYVLQDNTLLHTGADDASFTDSFSVVATDSDGSTDTASLDITIVDDVPSPVDADSASQANTNGAVGYYDLDADDDVDNNFGADQNGAAVIFDSASISALESQELTSGLLPLSYEIVDDGAVLIAYTGATFDIGDSSNWVFKLELEPTSFDDQYSVEMYASLDATFDVNFNDGTYDFLGGNTPWVGFVPDGQAPYNPGGGTYVNDNSDDLLITPYGPTASTAINGTANSVGVTGISGGQNIGAGEGVRLDFVTDLTGDPAKGAGGTNDYWDGVNDQSDHSFEGHYTVQGAILTFGDGQTDTTVALRARIVTDEDPLVDLINETPNDLEDGGNSQEAGGNNATVNEIVIRYAGNVVEVFFDSAAGEIVVTANDVEVDTITYAQGDPAVAISVGNRTYDVSFEGTADGGQYAEVTGILDTAVSIAVQATTGYNALIVENMAGDDFELTGFGTTTITDDPVNFTVPITVVDGDGDSVSSGNLDITVNPVHALVALDLDGGGVQYVGRDAGVTYDYDNDGSPEATAWVGAGDGILVVDINTNNDVDGPQEFSPVDYDALAAIAALDSNADDQLTVADPIFGQMGVWQDADQDGVVDGGEYQSLTALGITSISLIDSGSTTSAANGEVVVLGTTTYTDGSGTHQVSNALVDPVVQVANDNLSGDVDAAAAMLSGGASQAGASLMSILENRLSDNAIAASAMAGFLLTIPQGVAAFESPQFMADALSSINAGWSSHGQNSLMIDATGFYDFDAPMMLADTAGQPSGAAEMQASITGSGAEPVDNPLADIAGAPESAPAETAIAEASADAPAISFAGPDMSASAMMDALLILGDAVSPARSADAADGTDARAALVDALAEGGVDALIDQFVDHVADSPSQVSEHLASDLSGILGMDLGGSGVSMVPGVNEVSVDEGTDVALLHG